MYKCLLFAVGGMACCFSLSAQILQTVGPSAGDGWDGLNAINNAGVAVGTSTTNPGDLFGYSGIYSTGGGTLSYIGTDNIADGGATAINNSGIALATINGAPVLFNTSTQATTYIQPLISPYVPSGDAYISDINDSDQILVGNFVNETAFIYSQGTVTHLPGNVYVSGLNDSDQVTGQDAITNQAILYSGGTVTDLGTLGGPTSNGQAINSLGVVVGVADVLVTNTEDISDAFMYSNGVMTDLGNLGVFDGLGYSDAYAINDSDEVVGSAYAGYNPQTNETMDAFLYTNGHMYNLNSVFAGQFTTEGSSTPGFLDLIGAYGINDEGQIVGIGDYWDGTQVLEEGFILNTNGYDLPDKASSAGLLLLGLALVFTAAWRRAKNSA